MGATITQRELRNSSAQIMDRVQAGESFTVTRNYVPVARLLPIMAGQQQHAEPLRDARLIADALRGLPRLDYQAIRREADDFFDDNGDRV